VKSLISKIALNLMMLAVFGITVHIYSHAFPGYPQKLTECEFCDNMASTSVPGPAIDIPKPVLVAVENPAVAPELISVAFIDAKPSRAPPIA